MEKRSNPEGRLCGHLAATMAKVFHGEQTSTDQMYVPNYDMSVFARLAEALIAVGVVEWRPLPNGGRYPNFSMLPEDMPDYLEGSLQIDDPRIPEVIRAFVDCAVQHPKRGRKPPQWPSPLSSFIDYPRSFTPSWWKVDDEYRAAMESFVKTGYAEQEGQLFRWTKKMSVALLPDEA